MSRQYMNASKAVTAIMTSSGSLKSYCNRNKVGKTDYALICQTLKYVDVLEALFRMSEMSAETLDVNPGALFVYCYELLFGAGKIQGGGAVKRRLMEHAPSLRESLTKYLKIRGVTSHQDLIDSHFTEHAQMPIYVRINTLKPGSANGLKDMKCIHEEASMDKHIPNLVVLPAGTKRTGELDRVKSSDWIIQDKASCMPSQILADVWCGGDLIDACAAPGNKTSHLAALIMESGRGDAVKILAFDKSEVRWKLLRDRMTKAAAVNVSPTNADFLAVDVNDPLYSNVTAALVDPSCSGSGVVRAIDRVYERVRDGLNHTEEVPAERLNQLRTFQIKAILKAMSFPKVNHVVYSTCSINEVQLCLFL
jgi:putative methyltransferase